MKSTRWINTILLFLGLASSTFAYAAQGRGNENRDRENDKRDASDQKGKKAKGQDQQREVVVHQDNGRGAPPQRTVVVQDNGRRTPPQRTTVVVQEPVRTVPPQRTVVVQDNSRTAPPQRTVIVQNDQGRPPGWDRGRKTGWGNSDLPPGQQKKLSDDRRRMLIDENQQRVVIYRQNLDQQQAAANRYAEQLQRDRRMAYYRYQQEYLARLRQQQIALQRNYNYAQDPYFNTPPIYRYRFGNSSFEVNQYGADMLRQAINNGYDQGYRAGLADRRDRWAFGYQNSFAYQDGNYGYNGLYVNQDSYNYYFREGFQRGYQDGYYSRSQFGTYSGGRYTVLGTILGSILDLQSLR